MRIKTITRITDQRTRLMYAMCAYIALLLKREDPAGYFHDRVKYYPYLIMAGSPTKQNRKKIHHIFMESFTTVPEGFFLDEHDSIDDELGTIFSDEEINEDAIREYFVIPILEFTTCTRLIDESVRSIMENKIASILILPTDTLSYWSKGEYFNKKGSIIYSAYADTLKRVTDPEKRSGWLEKLNSDLYETDHKFST